MRAVSQSRIARRPSLADDDVAGADVGVHDRLPGRFRGRVALEPPEAEGEGRRRIEQRAEQVVDDHQRGADRTVALRPWQCRRRRGRVDAVQPRHGVAQLRHDAFAGSRPAAVNEAEHATGHRLAVDGRADEERAAQHRRVGADVMDVGDRDAGLLGEGADGRLAGDVEQLDRRGGDHRQGEAPRLRAGDGVEERVDASSAGRRQREALDDDGSVPPARTATPPADRPADWPPDRPADRRRVWRHQSPLQSSWPGFEMARSSCATRINADHTAAD